MFNQIQHKEVLLSNKKHIIRLLHGERILHPIDKLSKTAKHFYDKNLPISTYTRDGEAFIGDIILFEDGYTAQITFILERKMKDQIAYYVYLNNINEKMPSQIMPRNGRESWNCTIVKCSHEIENQS